MHCPLFVHDWLASIADGSVWWKLTRGPHLQWAIHHGTFLARVCVDPPVLQFEEASDDFDQEEFYAALPRVPFTIKRSGILLHAQTGQPLYTAATLTHIPCAFQWPPQHPITFETAWMVSDWRDVQTWLRQSSDASIQLTLGDDLTLADRTRTMALPWAGAHTIDQLDGYQAWVARAALQFPTDGDSDRLVLTLQWSNELCRLLVTSDDGWMADRWIAAITSGRAVA